MKPLLPPCGYIGGKRRYAKTIVVEILQRNPSRVWDVCAGRLLSMKYVHVLVVSLLFVQMLLLAENRR